MTYLDLSWLISSYRILLILPAKHYSFCQPKGQDFLLYFYLSSFMYSLPLIKLTY
jgi:hypothetical protein